MTPQEAIGRLRDVLRRKHLALSTEQNYCAWLARYCRDLPGLPPDLPSERKIERFLTHLAHQHVSASTQNQAFNALVFFYREVLGQKLTGIEALRAKRAATVRRAPEVQEVTALISRIAQQAEFAVSLAVRLIYGCGLRVSEPLNLRCRDVQLKRNQLIIRGAKGGKDRVVPIPCSVVTDLEEQLASAEAISRRDQTNRLPVALPQAVARKYPYCQYEVAWGWLFPAKHPCQDPRDGRLVRWRLHEANVQRAVRRACAELGINILPHELRHAYATHCLNRGANPRALQQVMGHKSLETTMGYLHAEALSIISPLDQVRLADHPTRAPHSADGFHPH